MPAHAQHQRAAAADEAHRLLEVDDAGQVRGGHLAHAVPDHRVGLDACGTQRLAPGDGERHQQRLDMVDALHRCLRSLLEQGDQRLAEVRPRRGVAALQRLAEGRLALPHLSRHAQPLASLARADKDHARRRLRIGGAREGARATARVAIGVAAQRLDEASAAITPGNEGDAVLERTASRGGAPERVIQPFRRQRRKMPGKAGREGAQRLRAARGEREQPGPRALRRRGRRTIVGRRRF